MYMYITNLHKFATFGSCVEKLFKFCTQLSRVENTVNVNVKPYANIYSILNLM